MSFLHYILLASGHIATLYGTGELRCGPVGQPEACAAGATTSSGETFHPEKPTAAVAIPNKYHVRPGYVLLRLEGGECKPIRINDRMNERYVNSQIRWDLSPAAVKLLGGEPSPTWSGRVFLCFGHELHGGRTDYTPQIAGGAK
jgi:hypothetical protein